jgi:hypothetical protein
MVLSAARLLEPAEVVSCFYCEQPYQAAVREAFAQGNVPELRFEFESDGAQVIINDPFLDGDGNSGLRWHFMLSDFHHPRHPVAPTARLQTAT